MTRKEIQDQITLNLDDSRTNTVTQILTAIIIVLRELSSRMEWAENIRDGFIRTTSGRFQYPLEPDVFKVNGQFYIEENTQRLITMSTDEFNQIVPRPDKNANVPYVAMLPESYPVRQQPATFIRGISSSASDTMEATIFGEVYGLVTSEAITMSGTTGVLTTKEFTWVHRIGAASAPVGTLTFTANTSSGDTTLPTVATAGDFTVGTIAAGAVRSTDTIGPASLIRIKMDADVAGDRSQSVRVEGYTVDTTNTRDRLFKRETLTTDGTNATTSVVSSNRYSEITKIQKGWDSTNTLLVSADPTATLIGEVGPDRRSVSYQQARFYNITDGKTILYRYTPHMVEMQNDNDQPDVPELYHQMVAEWAEKIVRGWQGDFTRGIRTLSNNADFDRAIAEAQANSSPEASDSIILGGGWRNRVTSGRLDFPIPERS